MENAAILISENSKYFEEMLSNCKRMKNSVIQIAKNYVFHKENANDIKAIRCGIEMLEKKLSMKNDIWQFGKTKFYLPNYPYDFIQKHIVENNSYFEHEILKDLDEFIPDNATILDIGANIGNHSLYWAIERGAKKILAFEPVDQTFEILQSNIKINNLNNRVFCHKVGFSDVTEKAGFKTFRANNIGDTHLQPDPIGQIELVRMDDYLMDIDRIDFIKIDVEDYEEKVILGGLSTIKKYKPVIFVESYPDYFERMDETMQELDYEMTKEYGGYNYLYLPVL
jgi:FkbM family methyltransferase